RRPGSPSSSPSTRSICGGCGRESCRSDGLQPDMRSTRRPAWHRRLALRVRLRYTWAVDSAYTISCGDNSIMTSNFRSMGGAIVAQVRAVQAGSGADAHLQPFQPGADPRLLEGVLFVKPEATDVAGGVALD